MNKYLWGAVALIVFGKFLPVILLMGIAIGIVAVFKAAVEESSKYDDYID